MIDLDTLEQDALHLIDREAPTVQIVNPHTITALIHAVRAAITVINAKTWHDVPHEDMLELEEALAPFQPLDNRRT